MKLLSSAQAALCRLLPISVRDLGEAVGVQKSNLFASLAGRRGVPGRAWDALIQMAGLNAEGELDPGRLHQWKVRSPEDLRAVLETWCTVAEFWPLRAFAEPVSVPPRAWLLRAITATGSEPLFVVLDAPKIEASAGRAHVTIYAEALRVRDVADLQGVRGQPRQAQELIEQLQAGQGLTWGDCILQAIAARMTPDELFFRISEGQKE